jgi:hypothetical protein
MSSCGSSCRARASAFCAWSSRPDKALLEASNLHATGKFGWSKHALIASALKPYTRSPAYLETLNAGSARIDLEGNPVGTVTDARRRRRQAEDRCQARSGQGDRGPPPNLLRNAPDNKTRS